ncbi:FtsW/RodA/SpoVE family cell cycle protein [Lactobacillus kefiranofaciens]|uniref:Probable peptidoglycan glycosyltransferase FtsW n=1 Tax=Lactobacillus kefiranofaciens TaxID=267818 RepID=A0AAX3UFB4_9LACO|nr:putative peptidoglycan glycosyltransferase FtsW [Lactobacillus kefiranofaciens]AEG40511.1 Cell division protein FtsW [Lactobacillus kefiranofaciens subsp. kefiranofaciens]KRM22534.1 cell division protein FtsW [Lactobacillus kefiranofaciens subsp. kefiranofaciens DSM 5016 = JCM 6985]QFQ68039.1 cell division protein FtsW [Lactobacillus kefiranofaciens subsp. kefiranofaciens]WGO86185.1 putative peptidoglycan glycosyltransferase FtsW [Lactobacillus kefiranofaciens]WQH36496.1 putative peptidogly
MRRKLRYLDYKIFIPYLILVILGVILVYSASSDILLVNGFKPDVYGIRQAIYAVAAFALFGVPFYALKIKVFKSPKFVASFLLICILMLMWLVFLRFAHGSSAAVNGAVGWINLGFINLQPLEVTKLALVIYLAYVLDRRDGKLVAGRIKSNLSHPAILAAFLMCLVIVEPDFGGTAILFMITLVMFSVSGVPTKIALAWLIGIVILVGAVFCIVVAWNPKFLQESYQFQRLMSFLHPFELERKGGAQLVNSYYAIHNGGLLGVGLGNSMQKRGYLPEPYTDFILSITAEEMGVIFTIVLIGLLFYLMWKIMNVGVHAVSQFDALICFGVTTIIFTEAFFNIGAVLGLLPITGVTLPFISYGGSSMIVLTAAIGLVLNVAANEKMLKEKDETIA